MNHYTNTENLSNIEIENILQRFSSFSSFKTHWVKKYLDYRELVYKANLANLHFLQENVSPFLLMIYLLLAFVYAEAVVQRCSV